jgi:hypothetical protein
MIVSHSRAFVFVAVPKTGSQAVRLALRPCLNSLDWEQCGLFEQKRFPVPALAELGHGHISCSQLRPFLLPEMWDRYRRFAFVRDPLQRFLSLTRFWYAAQEPRVRLDSGKRILTDERLRRHPLVRPQSEFVCDADGELLVDRVGLQAELAADFSRVCEWLDLPLLPLVLRNASPVPAAELEPDSELLGLVADFYRQDFLLPGLRRKADGA